MMKEVNLMSLGSIGVYMCGVQGNRLPTYKHSCYSQEYDKEGKSIKVLWDYCNSCKKARFRHPRKVTRIKSELQICYLGQQ